MSEAPECWCDVWASGEFPRDCPQCKHYLKELKAGNDPIKPIRRKKCCCEM